MLMSNSFVFWGWEKKERTMLRFIKTGDVFSFQYDEKTFCFGRILLRKEKIATIAEIFNYISDVPIISKEDIDRASRIFSPINIDAYTLFDRKLEGEWRVIGHCENHTPKDADSLYFARGYPPTIKMDILGNETAVSGNETETLLDLAYYGDPHAKELIETYLSGLK
jgi:hypothetical protein